ncbi:MAG: hypothetical protein AABW99_00285 [archaeon]
MLEQAKKISLVSIALLALLGSMILLALYGVMQNSFLKNGLFSEANPIGVVAVFAIIILGGIYLFNAAAHIIKGAIK